jgi:hypothetical protein
VQARYLRLAGAAAMPQYAADEMRKALAALATNPPKAAGDWQLKAVTYSGEVARIEIARKSDQTTVRFDMERQPDRRWVIVQADPEEMAALMQ